jgi:hypothetical protein
MRMKQISPPIACLLFCMSGIAVAAPEQGKEADSHGRHTGLDDSGVRIHIRTEEEKKRREARNSNRQSEPDASRGLERAGERRAEPADAHSQAGGVSKDSEDGWYEYFFGKRQASGKEPDLNWYEYLFGRSAATGKADKEKDEQQDKDSSWWWPFD